MNHFSLAVIITLFVTLPFENLFAEVKKCLYVSSFHPNHPSSGQIESELKRQLNGLCQFEEHYLDGKRNKDIANIRMQALLAKQKIDSWKPDVVIISDNITAKYLLEEHFHSSKIPFVFCGSNHAAENGQQANLNATGIIERLPILPVLDLAKQTVIPLKSGAYLGADTPAERKNLLRYQEAAEKDGVIIHGFFSTTGKEWVSSLQKAQDYDFLILGSTEGIASWETTSMIFAAKKYSKKLSITNHQWMMFYSLIGFTKIPAEQGAWAGKIVKEILNGASPKDIPITSNRKFSVFINPSLKKIIPVDIPKDLEMTAEYIS